MPVINDYSTSLNYNPISSSTLAGTIDVGPLHAKNVSSGAFREITVGDRPLLQTSSNGNSLYFDANTGIRAFGGIQNITGTEGGSYQRFVGLGDRAPIILENPSTIRLLDSAATTVGGVGAIRGGVKAASIFLAEETFERYTGLPSLNPLSLKNAMSGRRANSLLSDPGVTPNRGGSYVRSDSPAVQRTLPKNKYGVLEPDVDVPHTQLGRSTPSHGAEPQAREWMFDSKGRLVPTRDIDFTDHGFPEIHPNPHQHNLIPANPQNPVGGGFHRGEPIPLVYPDR